VIDAKRRLRVLLLAIFILLALARTASHFAGENMRLRREMAAPPSLVMEGDSSRDLGVLLLNKKEILTVKISNPHPYPIDLSEPETGCDCTRAAFSAQTIPPNGIVMLYVVIRPDTLGAFNAGVAIHGTRASQSCDLRLLISARIVKARSS